MLVLRGAALASMSCWHWLGNCVTSQLGGETLSETVGPSVRPRLVAVPPKKVRKIGGDTHSASTLRGELDSSTPRVSRVFWMVVFEGRSLPIKSEKSAKIGNKSVEIGKNRPSKGSARGSSAGPPRFGPRLATRQSQGPDVFPGRLSAPSYSPC